MNCWSEKIAVVTGASQGIGLAISKELARYKIKVIGLARGMVKLMEVAATIGQYFVPLECDIMEEDEILSTFKLIEENFGGVDILVNNAATCSLAHIMESEEDEIEDIVKTNLIAPAILARKALNSMRKRGTRGHIINISGTPGLYFEAENIPMGMYGPTKYGLRVLGTVLRHEIAISKLNVKVTISEITVLPQGMGSSVVTLPAD
ncbi:farnesol dehydrogenase-like isoform X2 [Bombus pyrosoma]|uniref:farnesol dehydrogenase-like isoform X2 n=1 Tax=Bombus pyrosoma TaxID=396416 RepID=UPI001CB92C7F|nr:farnesol dehydrogenase-like isoform X2 [Bombus pyrosoma]